MADNSVGFDYQAVEAVKNQVAQTEEEVGALFRRIDADIEANIGAGTQFRGSTAEEFKSSWEDAKSCFNNYTDLITEICNSAQQAGGIYRETEAAGQVSHL